MPCLQKFYELFLKKWVLKIPRIHKYAAEVIANKMLSKSQGFKQQGKIKIFPCHGCLKYSTLHLWHLTIILMSLHLKSSPTK